MTQQDSPPETDPPSVRRGGAQAEITHTLCPQCGAKVSGLNNRYACGICGWVNHWSEGSTDLPRPEDDADWPGRDADQDTRKRKPKA